MGNPRLIHRRTDSKADVGVRGRALGETFHLYVEKGGAASHDRLDLEDRLLEEARGVIRRAETEGALDWVANGFLRNEDLGTWDWTLTADQVKRLMRL